MADSASGHPRVLLPMRVQVGDRFADESGEWEVVTGPSALRGGKLVRVRVQRPGDPASVRDHTWAAHERVEVVRSLAGLPATRPPKRPPAKKVGRK